MYRNICCNITYLCCELSLYFQWIPAAVCYVGAQSVSDLIEHVMQLKKRHNICTLLINMISKVYHCTLLFYHEQKQPQYADMTTYNLRVFLPCFVSAWTTFIQGTKAEVEEFCSCLDAELPSFHGLLPSFMEEKTNNQGTSS